MFNLIQTMDALRSVPIADLTKYVDGKNPQVPSYIALMEMNRRKQADETANAFYGQQPTLKDQITSSLTQGNHLNAPTGINPAQMQGQVNPAAPPVQLSAPTAPPAQMMPQQVNPAAPPKQMAEGGLASLPTPNMFNQSSYYNGGIVAFAEPVDGTVGAQTIDQLGSQLDEVNSRLDNLKAPGLGLRKGDPRVLDNYLNQKNILEKEKNDLKIKYENSIKDAGLDRPSSSSLNPTGKSIVAGSNPVMQQLLSNKSVLPSAPVVPDSDAAEKADRMQPSIVGMKPTTGSANTEKKGVITLNNNSAAPKTPAPVTPSTPLPASPKDLTDAELYARHKDLEKLAGVKEDPYSDIKQRYADIENARKTRAQDDPYNRIMERLTAFGMADPSKGFAHAAGASAVAGSRLEKEQNALHDKEGMEMAGLQMSFAKEEDARRRGDVAGVEAARKEQQEYKTKLAELAVHQKTADAHMISALANRATAGKPTSTQEMIALYNSNPELANTIFGKKTSYGKTEAFDDAIKMSMPGTSPEQITALAMKLLESRTTMGAPPIGTVKNGFKYKGGNPNEQSNWEKV
jgi:hypothetical protein